MPQMHLFRRSMPSFRTAMIRVSSELPSLTEEMQFAELLHGSDDVAGSLVPITANDSVAIHAAGKWRLRNKASLNAIDNGPLSTTVTVTVNFAAANLMYKEIDFNFGQTVTLTRP
jgi:hypothetical protein